MKAFASFIFFVIFLFNSLSFAFADSKSDFEYQFGKYRQGYADYTLAKQDFLSNPTLDNQHKAMLAIKESLVARDLAKASFASYLLDLININGAVYEPISPITNLLISAKIYFGNESSLAQGVITQANLKQFSGEYAVTSPVHDRTLKYGIVAHKVSKLVKIQLDLHKSYEDILPKLPKDIPIPLSARLSELLESEKQINAKINALAVGLNPTLDEDNLNSDVFYTSRIQKLSEIRQMQLDWINRLIDIDINYVQSQN